MKALLDTHAFLWFIMGDPRLSHKARATIEDVNNVRLFSAASAWEIAIKVSLGKLTLAQPFSLIIPRELSQNGFQWLPIEQPHVDAVATLPFPHRDPFDRMLIAQALAEQIPIIGNDPAFDAYGVPRLW